MLQKFIEQAGLHKRLRTMHWPGRLAAGTSASWLPVCRVWQSARQLSPQHAQTLCCYLHPSVADSDVAKASLICSNAR